MWQEPKNTTLSYVAPEVEIEANNGTQYLVRPIEIRDEGVGRFADPADPDPSHNIRWIFTVHWPEDRTAILNVEGRPFEHHDYTSSKTGKGRSHTARAREWMEALMGRELEDSEINDSLTPELLKRAAIAIFETVERTSRGGETYEKLRIDKMFPYRPSQRTARRATVTEAAVEPVAPAPPPARPAPRPVVVQDDEEQPWP